MTFDIWLTGFTICLYCFPRQIFMSIFLSSVWTAIFCQLFNIDIVQDRLRIEGNAMIPSSFCILCPLSLPRINFNTSMDKYTYT